MKKTFILIAVLVLGILIGGYIFSDSQPRSFLALHRCEGDCLQPAELAGLIASVIVQKIPGVLPNIILETEKTVAISHPFPQTRVHAVIIPKKDIKDAGNFSNDDGAYLVDAFAVMQKIIHDQKLEKYRIITNGPGIQNVRYMHFHLVAD